MNAESLILTLLSKESPGCTYSTLFSTASDWGKIQDKRIDSDKPLNLDSPGGTKGPKRSSTQTHVRHSQLTPVRHPGTEELSHPQPSPWTQPSSLTLTLPLFLHAP